MSDNNVIIQPSVVPVGEIPFDQLTIPPYQRPYKWTSKNVNQLINDILTFYAKKKEHYRLGTLVLYSNNRIEKIEEIEKANKIEIVDGQQRIITLTLLLKRIIEKLKDDKLRKSYDNLTKKIKVFTEGTTFSNRYSLHNVIENIHAIDNREVDLDENILDFIVSKCEFVVIRLESISESFQFFDSQNARGKDLEPHDLLKAYHLREINNLSESDSENIFFWQNKTTLKLKEIFLTLYRAKRWSQGKSARYFTKDNIDVFKGVSLQDDKRYPFYQMEVIAHIFSTFYNTDKIRQIDQQKIEFPFNLDDQIVNGSRFFDMIRHYLMLFDAITATKKEKREETYSKSGKAIEIICLISDYEGMERTGDRYVKNMFYTLVLYYIDRFGYEELDKIVPKFFIWAYFLRLTHAAVQLASVDDYSSREDSMFRIVHDSRTPYDIISISQSGLSNREIKCSKCNKIIEMFYNLKKIQHE